MNYWIMVVKDWKFEGKIYIGQEIFEQRIQDRFWGFDRYHKKLSKGDKVVFYLGVPKKLFAGTATLATPCFELSNAQKEKYSHGKKFYTADYGVELEESEIWSNPKSIEDLLPYLNFIENKEYWGAYLQGGARQISEEDYKTITRGKQIGLVEQIKTSKDIESPAEFALETHLEEFIHQNWDSIRWGTKLELYKAGEQEGRQFPAGTWSIDFLAVDKANKEFVVIELKKGKTSDAVVGQVQRYISWVKENVAEKRQKVKGIIIAKEVDEALKYAVKDLPHIRIKTYKVDFQLQ